MPIHGCRGVLASLVFHVAVGVERSLDAVHNLRGADQKPGLQVVPVDALEVRTGLAQQLVQVEVSPAHPQQRESGGNRLTDSAARIDAEEGRFEAKNLFFLRSERGVCKQVEHPLGGRGRGEPLPEVFELIDGRARRARLAVLPGNAVPHYEGAQRARRGATQAHQFEAVLLGPVLVFDGLKDFAENADLEGGMYPPALTANGHFLRLIPLWLIPLWVLLLIDHVFVSPRPQTDSRERTLPTGGFTLFKIPDFPLIRSESGKPVIPSILTPRFRGTLPSPEPELQEKERQRKTDAVLAKFRQDLARGVARYAATIQARKAGATLQAIGDVLGVTKERVRQLINRQ